MKIDLYHKIPSLEETSIKCCFCPLFSIAKPTLRSSSLSAASVYYSFDEAINENFEDQVKDPLVHLKSIGQRYGWFNIIYSCTDSAIIKMFIF